MGNIPNHSLKRRFVLNGVGLSPFSTIYPCEALTTPHVGFKGSFYTGTKPSKSCRIHLVVTIHGQLVCRRCTVG
uniref:Uncharacterized protein n=1 Tax=Myoviridae sp. ctj3P51 TaxID=2826687 RepID=A0A8S5NP25_9CAUD|nr:MAG TPA: hypothetical protein [Myoviridae sp. ctj3P51]